MRKFKNILFLLFFSILMTGCATVQKRVMVTQNLSSNSCNVYGCTNLLEDEGHRENLTKECMKFSYRKSDIDRLLREGAKIISAIPTEKVVEYKNINYDPRTDIKKITGKCIGTEYIIEGYQVDFDELL